MADNNRAGSAFQYDPFGDPFGDASEVRVTL